MNKIPAKPGIDDAKECVPSLTSYLAATSIQPKSIDRLIQPKKTNRQIKPGKTSQVPGSAFVDMLANVDIVCAGFWGRAWADKWVLIVLRQSVEPIAGITILCFT